MIVSLMLNVESRRPLGRAARMEVTAGLKLMETARDSLVMRFILRSGEEFRVFEGFRNISVQLNVY